jgi:hypothetical protein
LIGVDPRESTEKNFAVAQLLRIDPLPFGGYSHFTSHQENQPRAAAIGRTTFCVTLGTAEPVTTKSETHNSQQPSPEG